MPGPQFLGSKAEGHGNLPTYQVLSRPYQHANHQVKTVLRPCAWARYCSLVAGGACRVLGPELRPCSAEPLRLDWQWKKGEAGQGWGQGIRMTNLVVL